MLLGITFSPDGKFAYVTDTGINQGFRGYNFSEPSSMLVHSARYLINIPSTDTRCRYRFEVNKDGTWDNRKTFAFIDSGVPDGKLIP